MARSKMLILWVLLICMGTVLVAMNGCSGASSSGGPPPPPKLGDKIKHVVIIFQENRTPDNLFHDQNLINAGADIATQGTNSSGQTVTLTPTSLVTDFDISHAHSAFEKMCYGADSGTGNCTMNGADLEARYCTTACPDTLPFQYVQQADVQPYWTLAETYVFGDRMFQTNQGPSYPAHQYIISGSTGITESSATSLAENPHDIYAGNTGCSSPAANLVQTIDTSNPSYPANEDANNANSPRVFPCFTRNTIMDQLDAKSISWKYYANMGVCPVGGPCPKSGIWVGPNAIEKYCGNGGVAGTPCTGSEWTEHVVANTTVLTDIQNGNLPSVSWVIPDGKASDHANSNTGEGPAWVASVVNAIGQSQYWADTAIIITWDDWGGWYDHVAPPMRNSYEYGFRVPLIVVSPYAKAKYISHQMHDFGSILKFTEAVFSLSSIDPNGLFADSRADDMTDCFDLTQTPLTFSAIPAKYNAAYFLNDKRPPSDPDDD